MNRETTTWTIKELRGRFPELEFPDYQREPNIWRRDAKQRLIDSIFRQFDIASLYFYKQPSGVLECIDGRQRLNAIMAFLDENPEDEADNGFALRVSNEITENEDATYQKLNDRSFVEIEQLAEGNDEIEQGTQKLAKQALQAFLDYRLTVVLLSGAERPEEFNLQFIRLNLGSLINGGEKLHAMIGNMRDVLFGDNNLGSHGFLGLVKIPNRRYAKQLIAAQVLIQVFALSDSRDFVRARHFDLQKFLKTQADVPLDHDLIREVRLTFDALRTSLADREDLLRSRAIAVSVAVLAWRRRLFEDPKALTAYRDFLAAFLHRLRWQVRKMKEFEIVEHYRYLVDFQRHVTQASVEKPAVSGRHKTLNEEFDRWLKTGRVRGDEEFQAENNQDPNIACLDDA